MTTEFSTDPAPAPQRRTRLSPQQREQMILRGAIDLFAERGFGAQTKELAARLGVSEPLIYRYFPTKDVLIERVYEATILSRWDPMWEVALRARRTSLRVRLTEFYESYLNAVDDPVWTRIVMYSSLDGLDLTRGYILAHVDKILTIISEELSVTATEGVIDREIVWHLHSTFIYYLIRKHIHRTPVADDVPVFISEVVSNFLEGLAV